MKQSNEVKKMCMYKAFSKSLEKFILSSGCPRHVICT